MDTRTPARRGNPPHGTDSRYIAGCRCQLCRRGHAEAAARRRRLIAYGRWRGETDACGTIRRLRALFAAGWSAVHIGAEAGLDPSWIRALTRGEVRTVRAATADRFAALYRRLAEQDGPSEAARRHARRRGWHDHWAWTDDTIDDPSARPFVGDDVDVDWVKVERALAGERVRLTGLERQHAVRAGVPRLGLTGTAAVLRMSYSTARDLYRRPLPADEAVAA